MPTKKYTIEFRGVDSDSNQTIEVDPASFPMSGTGKSGSILDIAMGIGIEIDHACGGVCACSTCHVRVIEGLDSCSESTEEEEDQLEEAPALTMNSRLACQCIPDGTRKIVVEIPAWNRNAVKEGKAE